MRKLTFLIMAMTLSSLAFAQKVYFDLTDNVTSNVTVVPNADNSVTLTLTDDTQAGTITFNSITDFTPYTTVEWTYIQEIGRASCRERV